MRHIAFYSLCIGIIHSFFFASSVNAASFDCKKAEGKIDRTICNHPELSSLDEEMSALYFSIKNDPIIPPENLKIRQKTFLSARNACAREKNVSTCLEDSYQEIINEYQQTPRSTDIDNFQFSMNIKKRYIRFDLSYPEWSYLADVYVTAAGCSEGTWCESNGYLAVKDTTTELITQVIYLPRAFFFMEAGGYNKIRISYNKKMKGLLSIFDDTQGYDVNIIIPCASGSGKVNEMEFQYRNNRVYFLIDKNSCARKID
ncbi:lysozyme inhibitor LprI family protein [Pectobacterium parmentieri]|uniref:DUF1311 domain-containing protein n=1 Tax=Pectobacterium parmentieri TaxID=1905730 RepID=A0A8B3F8N0_PECPM|nr:hypothetical protein [Pectobacterium parmentieri]AOR58945.1 hypothetical protein A8F97_08495 [Pectobacterium parmentieri]AYH10022.1 hypothetical protein C5E24_10190 [Pectobacterium parmentieri]AYH19267.1 hypothetical protein C5E22_12600 [Pectobacterium parmentieri]AYH36342.1 hypothetical protein C5E17_10140 [Pectobacterium parmentieri]AZS56447.1 hypothetical protein C5E18_10135 [Pectobacterium parmentieri]